MSPDQLDKIRNWFGSYVAGLFGAFASHPACIDLKVEHTMRVADNARCIAQELGWDEGSFLTAEALGWLHDVGRFTQFAEFGHFHDATSVNHGECGGQIVRDSEVLGGVSEDDRRCLLEGIRLHNVRTIPNDVDSISLPYLKLIRDADKLDIYRVVIEALEKDGFRELKNMWPQINLDGGINPVVLEAVRMRTNCSIAQIRSLADFLLLQVGWGYELCYAPTFARVARQEILPALARYLPDEVGPREVLEKAREYVCHAAGMAVASCS